MHCRVNVVCEVGKKLPWIGARRSCRCRTRNQAVDRSVWESNFSVSRRGSRAARPSSAVSAEPSRLGSDGAALPLRTNNWRRLGSAISLAAPPVARAGGASRAVLATSARSARNASRWRLAASRAPRDPPLARPPRHRRLLLVGRRRLLAGRGPGPRRSHPCVWPSLVARQSLAERYVSTSARSS